MRVDVKFHSNLLIVIVFVIILLAERKRIQFDKWWSLVVDYTIITVLLGMPHRHSSSMQIKKIIYF